MIQVIYDKNDTKCKAEEMVIKPEFEGKWMILWWIDLIHTYLVEDILN